MHFCSCVPSDISCSHSHSNHEGFLRPRCHHPSPKQCWLTGSVFATPDQYIHLPMLSDAYSEQAIQLPRRIYLNHSQFDHIYVNVAHHEPLAISSLVSMKENISTLVSPAVSEANNQTVLPAVDDEKSGRQHIDQVVWQFSRSTTIHTCIFSMRYFLFHTQLGGRSQ
jgi:uncharacterized circularly permuted ATP-grasp superfamily protein